MVFVDKQKLILQSYSQLYHELFRNAVGAFRVSEEKVHSFLWVFILQRAEFSTLPRVS